MSFFKIQEKNIRQTLIIYDRIRRNYFPNKEKPE